MIKRKNLGFTLIELVIVIAVLAILALVTLPSFIEILERNRLRQPVELLKTDLQVARTEAIKRSQAIVVSRATGNAGAWCYGLSTAACDCATPGSCTIKTVAGGQFGNVDMSSVFSANVSFEGRKGRTSANNTCFKTDNYIVKVYNSNEGRVQVCTDTLGAGYPLCSSVSVTSCP